MFEFNQCNHYSKAGFDRIIKGYWYIFTNAFLMERLRDSIKS